MQEIIITGIYGPGSVEKTFVRVHDYGWAEETEWMFVAKEDGLWARFDYAEAYYVPQNKEQPGYWEKISAHEFTLFSAIDGEEGMFPGHVWGHTAIRFYFVDERESITVSVGVYPPEMAAKGATAFVDGMTSKTKIWYPRMPYDLEFDLIASCPKSLKFRGWKSTTKPYFVSYQRQFIYSGGRGDIILMAHFAERTGMPMFLGNRLCCDMNGRMLCDA